MAACNPVDFAPPVDRRRDISSRRTRSPRRSRRSDRFGRIDEDEELLEGVDADFQLPGAGTLKLQVRPRMLVRTPYSAGRTLQLLTSSPAVTTAPAALPAASRA